jgi:hypothetical protein
MANANDQIDSLRIAVPCRTSRASRVAAAVVVALLTLPSLAFGGTTSKNPRLRSHGSKVKFEIERVATSQPAVLDGVVRDADGSPLPGVTVVVRDEASQRDLVAITDVNGAFSFASLSDGLYRVEVMLAGFKSARVDHLPLTASEVTHARVALRLNLTGREIAVGAIVRDSIASGDRTMSTTFTKDFIDNLPF